VLGAEQDFEPAGKALGHEFPGASQVRPDNTRDRFWSAKEATTDEAKAVQDGSEQVFGRIVNPERLLADIR
jgi:hypothetical protein